MSPKEFLKLSKRKFPKYLRLLPFFLLIPLFMWLRGFITIKNISCTDQGIPCDSEISQVLNRYLDSSFFSLNTGKVKQEMSKVRPIKNLSIHYQLPKTLIVDLETENKFIPIRLALVADYPALSYSKFSESTFSASFFQKPSSEISALLGEYSYTHFKLWFDGNISPVATESSSVIYLSREKPSRENLKSIFDLIFLVNKYVSPDMVYVLGNTIFLSRNGQPDIITSVPHNEGQMIEALQSLGFLTTMKSDPKIIDLRFKNPTIR